MKKPWIAALLNFFLMGLGTFYVGKRKVLGVVLTLSSIFLTSIEMSLKNTNQDLFMSMFATIFLMNIFLALDGYNEAKSVNESLSSDL